ncbi:hypothetical protein FRC10_005180 [Ceratobasidium sp. 414]|nr:hypothetical protein FRC10_005180 [Ceratobasidium sp. 414]
MARCTTLRTIDGSKLLQHCPALNFINFTIFTVRGLLPLELQPGIISLLAGKPNPRTFPIEQLSITLRSPTAPQPYQPNVDPSSIIRETLTLKDVDISTALQYSFTDGIPELRQVLAEFQKREHGVDVDNVKLQLAMGTGSQDLLYKAFSKVETDPSGLSIDHLRSTLESWPVGKRLPKALYTVPFGCNPTGSTTTLERRKALLELAEEYDFLILEDDPYFFLYFGSDERPPSYLSLENTQIGDSQRQRRVLRFDSFSKVFSGGTPLPIPFLPCPTPPEPNTTHQGMRIGFVTGPPDLVKSINSHTSAANLQAASTTQSIILAILKHWGHPGFHAHITNIAGFYRAKRDVFDKAMVKHFRPQGGKVLAEWTKPEAGLFFWFKLNLPPSKDDSFQLIRTEALAKGVLAVPGTTFYPGGRKSAYVRAAFSVLEQAEVDEGLRRLAEVVKETME